MSGDINLALALKLGQAVPSQLSRHEYARTHEHAQLLTLSPYQTLTLPLSLTSETRLCTSFRNYVILIIGGDKYTQLRNYVILRVGE